MASTVPGFILVPKGGGKATDMDKKPISNRTEKDFHKLWDEVHKHYRKGGGCQAIICYDSTGNKNWEWAWTRNTRWSDNAEGYHAEENLFKKLGKEELTVRAVLITIEPCRDHRYGNGHNCYEFFGKGRKVDRLERKFIAEGPETPVFYLEEQPRPGERSMVWRDLARLDKEFIMKQYLANLGGVEWGHAHATPKPEKWFVSGQAKMDGEDIVRFLHKANPLRVWKFEDLNLEDCSRAVKDEVSDCLVELHKFLSTSR